MSSNRESVVDWPGSLHDVVPVKVLLAIVPADSIQTFFNLENHCAEAAYCGKIVLTLDRPIVRIKYESSLSPILLVKASKNQYAARINLESHCEVTRNPVSFVLDVDNIPNVFLNIVTFAYVSYFFRRELDAPAKHIDELSIENTASSWVSSYVQISHSYPFVLAHIVVFASFVEIFSIVSSYYVNTVFLLLVDCSEVRSRII